MKKVTVDLNPSQQCPFNKGRVAMPAADRFLECELSFPNVLRHSAGSLGELGSFSGIKANGD